ncbi:branched-chain amino acid transport system II carrier protein [Candidatus Dependentiae bacterium]|nr:branched-chain amino acid transport system II carrier protein [Candidatus Dependentiae bacterium]
MKKYFQSTTLTTGLAIFAMLFGAGNLIFPPKVGIVSGTQTWLGLTAFIITAVLLPLVGLIGMVFFDGDYRAFFARTGKIPGNLLILFCMLTIGPLLIMPRIVGLTYELISPFVGESCSILWFSLFFALLTFVCCYHKNKIVDLLGKILSPLKLLSMFTIISLGFWFRKPMAVVSTPSWEIFKTNFQEGYNTFDLVGMIFFAYIIIAILKRTAAPEITSNHRALAKVMLRGGIIGGFLLTLVYIGMGYLGAFHGQGLGHLDEGKIFITTIIRVLGDKGAVFISLTVLVACLSTMIALASVVSEYLRNDILQRKVGYTTALTLVLGLTTVIAQLKLKGLLYYSIPLILMVYPVIIVLTFCNIAYKLWGFKPVKIPVLLAFLLSAYMYGPEFIRRIKTGVPATSVAQEIAPL